MLESDFGSKVVASWQEFRKELGDMSELANELGMQALSWAQQDYEVKSRGGTDLNGIKWEDIQPETVAARIRKMDSYQLLLDPAEKRRRITEAQRNYSIGIDTGRLRNALVFGTQDNVFEASTDGSVTVGVAVKYGEYFSAARPIFPAEYPPQRQREIVKIVEEFVARKLKQAEENAARKST